jgi:hypothetical protein
VKLSSKDVKNWLERETHSTFIPVHAKAQKLIKEMVKALEDLNEAGRMLLDNSAKEIEKRNMKTYGRARGLNKLARLFLDRMRQLRVPDRIYYDNFSDFVRETQKAFAVTDVDVRNWFPRISPYFILDRRKFLLVFEKAKLTLKELNEFLTKDYVKTKTLEETFTAIDQLDGFEKELADLAERTGKVDVEMQSIDKEITDARQRVIEMRSKGGISQLDQLGRDTEQLSAEVRHSLQHLQKPFIKLQSLSLHGGGAGLTPDEIKKLGQYLENPFEALATEQTGYPLLKQILEKTARAISEGKLKLKPEKIRKAEQVVDNILNKDSLSGLHRKCVDAITRKSQLSTSTEVAETRSGLSKIQEQLAELERKRKRTEAERSSLVQTQTEIAAKVRDNKSRIEKNVLSFLGRRIHVE